MDSTASLEVLCLMLSQGCFLLSIFPLPYKFFFIYILKLPVLWFSGIHPRVCQCRSLHLLFLCFFLWLFFNSLVVLSYSSLFLICLILIILRMPVCFLRKDRVWQRMGGEVGEELRGAEGGETIARIYCIKIHF